MHFAKRFLLPGLILILLSYSCKRNSDLPVPIYPDTGNITASPVNGSVQGLVVDKDDHPVAGATVKAGLNTTTTDNRGLFRFTHIAIDKYASVVTVEANGYFKGIRTFSAKEGSTQYIKLQLLNKTLTGTVDAAAGGTVTMSNSTTVTLPAGAIVNRTTGAVYTGPVKVFAAYIDPTAASIVQNIPGSFQGADLNNKRVLLQSLGMIAVNLESPSGDALQIASGATAALHMPIPASLLSVAPATIPLWYMDETTGLWKQEGSATKTGNAYDGNVSHFSFWNLDIPCDLIYFEATITTVNGPMPNAEVKMTRINGGGSSYGFTDSTGYVSGFVFANEMLRMEVLDNCNEVAYTQDLGPYTQNTNIGTVVATITAINSLQVNGTAVDCSNQPIVNGTALVYFEGQLLLRPIVNGQFTANLLRCANSTSMLYVTVIDNTNNQESLPYITAAPTGTVSIGPITACLNSAVEYINYNIDGVDYSINSATPGDTLIIYEWVSGGETSMSCKKGNLPGCRIGMEWVWGVSPIGSFGTLAVPMLNQYGGYSTTAGSFTLNVTSYGNVGEFIRANFNGMVGPHTLTGSFKIRRQ